MNITVDIQVAVESDESPDPDQIRSWLNTALLDERRLSQLEAPREFAAVDDDVETELCVRIVDADESRALNHQYREKDYATNVLSFPSDLPANIPLRHLGDLIICAPVVAREAREQGKSLAAHWAHMVVHGSLHLLGYDHIENDEAELMEALETQIITGLGFPPPYEEPLVKHPEREDVNTRVAN